MTQSQQLRKLAARSATAFLLAALCVFPLYIDKFSNLGVVKFTGICTLSWAFALWLGALACVGARPDPGRLPWKADPALWALGAVTASGVVSTVLSLSPGASFWGLGGYYGGCMMVLFTAAGYLAVRAFAPQKILNGLTFCVGVTTALVTVLYVLNIFNIDLIGTYVDTAVVERAQFFSTLGQKNFCSGFMAFALPLVFYAFLVARGPRHTVFYGIPAFFGGLALAVVDAEGLMLGVGVAALVLICQKNFTTRTLRRLAVIGAFFFFHAGWMQYMRTHVYTQGGKPMLAALGHVAQRGFVVCLVVWAALYFGLRGRELPLYRPGRVLAGGIVAGAAVLTLLANCVPGFPSLGRLDDVLIFNDNWGTYRGTAWRITVESWLAQPVWRKLLGVGPGMMHTAMADWAGAGITDRMKTFYAAHNEYLELLLTTDAPECPAAVGISGNLARVAGALYAEWFGPDGWSGVMTTAGPDNPVYRTPAEVTRTLYTALDFGLERVEAVRLGRPLGSFEQSFPTRAEAWRSGLTNEEVAYLALHIQRMTAGLG